MQPPTYSPSFQKSMVNSGLVRRNSRTLRYMYARCSAVTISSGTAFLPTGMYVKSQANLAPLAIMSSKYSSLPMTS